MLHSLTSQAAAWVIVAAGGVPKPEAPSFLKTGGIYGILAFVATVIIIWIGIKIMTKSDKQKVGKSMETGANIGIGLVLVVIGFIGAGLTIVASMLGFFTNSI